MSTSRRSSGFPKAGTKWHYPGTRGYGFVVNHPAETRHVIDHTLGGDVIYCSGRYSRSTYRHSKCTLAEWNAWARNAKQVKP